MLLITLLVGWLEDGTTVALIQPKVQPNSRKLASAYFDFTDGSGLNGRAIAVSTTVPHVFKMLSFSVMYETDTKSGLMSRAGCPHPHTTPGSRASAEVSGFCRRYELRSS